MNRERDLATAKEEVGELNKRARRGGREGTHGLRLDLYFKVFLFNVTDEYTDYYL